MSNLEEIRIALQDPDVSLHIVPTFSSGRGVQVKVKTRKVGPLLFPADGQTLAELFALIGALSIETQPQA